MSTIRAQRTATARRGMLLLLVLSILALFIVVGAVGILLALRARESALAFAAASANQAGSSSLARAQLDEALLRLVRGGTAAGGVTESLLGDKYGTSDSYTVAAPPAGTTSAYVTASVTGLDTSNPATVAGRVLTFVPAAGDPTGPTSYRILRTGTTAGSVLLANVKPNTPLALPTVFPCEVVVNRREFQAEAYDAFDDQNAFLTQPVLQSSTIASVQRPAFGGTNAQCTVDNDGDGVPDGIWLDNVLPAQRSSSGGQLSFSVSYLVLDLDGRINLNAHGSFVRAQLPQTTGQYPKDPNTVPVGMGFGPADVDAARLVATPTELTSGVPARWALLLQGGNVTRNALVSSGTQWRPTPSAETFQQGRYTQGMMSGSAAPGNASVVTGANAANADYWLLNPLGNSPTDLKARLQVLTDGGSPPGLQFCRPAGAAPWAAVSDTEDIKASGTSAHPYALRLDEDAPRAAGTNAVEAPYTVGELERILRPFDADAATLAPRLAALLDDLAERSRMTVTTDSWDTPAITGAAEGKVVAAAQGMADPYAVLSPETVAGLRFNLNRPLVSSAARQDYFKQLYTLCVALGVPPADAAQWAANVIEFRDPDSIMTWYPYDPNVANGTWNTGTGVWGAERPEMVITDASVTDNQVAVKLYRPWKAQLLVGPSTTASGTTERIDGNLGDPVANTLDPKKVSGSDSVWRIATSSTAVGLATLITTATTVGTNASLALPPFTAVNTSTVRLERLANPSQPFDVSSNPYVTIQSVSGGATGSVSQWLHWPNRDLVSHGELLAVQSGSTADLAAVLLDGSKETSLARSSPAILEATIVPSRFAAANVSVANGSTSLAGTGYENFQYGQFSRWREAGRVNVNTILPNTGNNPSTLDNAVWAALVGRTDVPNPVTSGNPAQTLQTLLTGSTAAAFERSGADSASAFLKRATAIRLANVATVRSNVFAVWITLRITDNSPNAGPPQYARLFAIVDRSIPVGYAPGRTLNVRETIRLQRFLQ